MQLRDGDRRSEARADGAFGNSAGEARRPHAGNQRQPGNRGEFVVDEECFLVSGGMLDVGDRRIAAAVVENGAEGLVVVLIES